MGPQDQNCVGELAALVDAAGRARGLEYGRLYRSLYFYYLANKRSPRVRSQGLEISTLIGEKK